MTVESVDRIEPARLEEPTAAIADVIADLSAAAATLGRMLHPRTAANLADLVRLMNCYYSNLIEGHDTRPRDIERALVGDLDQDETRRDLQVEAAAHVRVQAKLDRMAQEGALPPPASGDFIGWMHREFYDGASEAMLTIKGKDRELRMTPGEWRTTSGEDVSVGNHQPPSSHRVADFMAHFEARFDFSKMGRAGQIMAIAAAHHRFNYIHPFPDGNGRVSRLMSHAMASLAGVGAHGLWSVSRGLARGLESRGDYMRMMDHADMPRQGDRDGRGNLSEAALQGFVLWFLRVCLDQVTFMSSLFDLDGLARRLRTYVDRHPDLKPQASRLLEEALFRGEFERGDIDAITGLPERTARRILADLTELGLLASDTPKGKVSLRFPAHALEDLFPRLFPQT
ncbi:MAG: Fic family protein [Phenylobacterium sp.]|uniref:Fic family protein n=1 Tax=Phenylobacterium sp. TaxID=1871053 RepID=UPI002736EF01|nr:Fic family protein [Phenylobacterium sp.]MDP3746719.1 Fic family protein [Phenylobacterium sp.]